MMQEKKAFDPTVSFMFFGTWVKTIQKVQELFGNTEALALFSAIAEYSMYEIEPDFSEHPIVGAFWITIEREIDLSVGNRKRGFSKDGISDNYHAIIQAIIDNPAASLREIAAMTNTDKNMVDRVKRKYSAEIEAAIASNASGNDSPVATAIASVTASVSAVDTAIAFDSVSVSVNVNDNDSMSRDKAGQMGQLQTDPLTCSPSLWRDLSDKEDRETLIEYYKANGVDMSAYEDDEDGLPF